MEVGLGTGMYRRVQEIGKRIPRCRTDIQVLEQGRTGPELLSQPTACMPSATETVPSENLPLRSRRRET